MQPIPPCGTRRFAPPSLSQRQGFTLLELALTMAIVALLAAFLWPVFAQARQAARRTSCAGNLRQLGIAFQMYVADWGHYPDPLTFPNSRNYVPDGRLLSCPDDSTNGLGDSPSSYRFTFWVPPTFGLLPGMSYVDPNVALVACRYHARVTHWPAKGSGRPARPDSGYFLIARAGGAVSSIPASRMRSYHPFRDHNDEVPAYPGEPGYEEAEPW